MKTVGFIGLGTMGLPMALNLLEQGYKLAVYNRTKSKIDELFKQGAQRIANPNAEASASTSPHANDSTSLNERIIIVDNPASAAREADVMITMLADDQSLDEVYYGTDGIFEGLKSGMTVIDCSTVSPAMSRRIHQDMQKQKVEFLDAPVTGSKPAAIAGTLLFMVGGNKDALEAERDIFETLGDKIIHMGPSGAGSQTKLAHNAIVGMNIAAFSEGLIMATKAGVDPGKFMDIVVNGNAGSRLAQLKSPRILERDFSVQFGLSLMLKDLDLASDLTTELGLTSPLLESARSLFRIAQNKGLGPDDMSSVLKCYEEWAGLEVGDQQK